MSRLIVHVIPEGGADVHASADELEDQLSQLPETDTVRVNVEQPRVGPAEILAVVQLGKAGIDLVKWLIAYVKEHRAGVKGIEIEIGGHRVPVDQLTPEQHAEVLKALSA